MPRFHIRLLGCRGAALRVIRLVAPFANGIHGFRVALTLSG